MDAKQQPGEQQGEQQSTAETMRPMDMATLWEESMRLWQAMLQQFAPASLPMTTMATGITPPAPHGDTHPATPAWLSAFRDMQNSFFPGLWRLSSAHFDSAKAQQLSAQFAAESRELWENFIRHNRLPEVEDRRFKTKAWQENPGYAFLAANYLLNARYLKQLEELIEDNDAGRLVRFQIGQWTAMTSPANFFATNPEAIQRLLKTDGQSLVAGIQNFLGDLQKGHISLTDEGKFAVGKNLAITPGNVVFQNPLFQLIEYAPQTAEVAAIPLLIVPPCINKYYILDLQPENSLVNYLVQNGVRVFMVSWRNVKGDDMGSLTWDNYVDDAVLKAIEVVQEITDSSTLNTVGFCIGGTLLGSALAVLARRCQENAQPYPVKSVTFLTTLLDFEDAGILAAMVTPELVEWREQTIGGVAGSDGRPRSPSILRGADLAMTFSMLRPEELIWNSVVHNYLMGQPPGVMDLLYWNSDSSNMSGVMYCWYLRHCYVQNEMAQPGKVVVCGVPIDLGRIPCDSFVFGSQADHIVPWKNAYRTVFLLGGEKTFVLGASGHIAGVINPPTHKRRSYWRRDGQLPPSPESWFEGAEEVKGSWWPEWLDWLLARSGGKVAAPLGQGSRAYPVREAAPGSYVLEKG